MKYYRLHLIIWAAFLIHYRNDVSSYYLIVFLAPLLNRFFLQEKKVFFIVYLLFFWESLELCYYLHFHKLHLNSPLVKSNVFERNTLVLLNKLSKDCIFHENNNDMMSMSSASHRDCPDEMDIYMRQLNIFKLTGLSDLSLAPVSDLSRWSVLLYLNNNFMKSHVDGNMYYGSRITGSLILNNSARAIINIDNKNYTLQENTIIFFEGNVQSHSIKQVKTDIRDHHRLAINFILTQKKHTQYRVSLLSRFHRMIVNALYYSTFKFT